MVRARINGTTALSIPGSSNAFGIWNRHCTIPTMFTPVWKTRPCLNRRTAANRGTNGPGTHQWYDGTQHPWEFKRAWHLEPSLHDPDHVYAGGDDAAIFESKDGGKSWHDLAGLRGSDTGPKWQPGAGGMCLHTILLDPKDPQRIYIAISAAGAFRTVG